MKVLLRRPKAAQETGAIGVYGGEDETMSGSLRGDGGDQGDADGGAWGGFVERGVYDEPIIRRWEDIKVRIRWPPRELVPRAVDACATLVTCSVRSEQGLVHARGAF